MFCKVPQNDNLKNTISSAVILSRMSDHFPCVVNFQSLERRSGSPKFIQKRSMTENNMNAFRQDLIETNILSQLNANLDSDPNIDYRKFHDLVTESFERHFPKKRIKFNKYKHKLSPWITSGILKSIEYRDNIYKKLHRCPQNSPEYDLLGYNLKTYNSYLNKCIRNATKSHYVQ